MTPWPLLWNVSGWELHPVLPCALSWLLLRGGTCPMGTGTHISGACAKPPPALPDQSVFSNSPLPDRRPPRHRVHHR